MSEATETLLAVAVRLADAARAASLAHFRRPGLGADNKAGAGGYDPVTEADRASEAAMRAVLAEWRPDDGILGEEGGTQAGSTGLTWVLDPVDGTRGFLAGTPTWGVLIGLDDGTRLRLGLIDQPFTAERWTGVAGAPTTYRRGDGAPVEVRTRACPALGDAILMCTDLSMFDAAEQAGFDAVRERVRLCRFGCDCYAYALLAMGQIDLVIEASLQAYDVGGLIPVVEGAGGVITGWRGEDCRGGGRVIAAGDPARHAEALEMLAKVP